MDISVHDDLERAAFPRGGGRERRIPREVQQLGIATYQRNIIEQGLTYTEDTLRTIHQFPEGAARNITLQHIPKMKYERSSHQVGQLEATGRIGLAQWRHIGAGDAVAIFSLKTFGKRGPQVAAIPRADAQPFTDTQKFGVVEKGIPAENGIFKKNGTRIQSLEAAAPPVEMQPVLMRIHQANCLYSNGCARRKGKPIDEQRNPIA